MENKEISKFVEQIIKEPTTRIEIVRRSHLFFLATYFSQHIQYKLAPFHYEMLRLTEDEETQLAVITAFRSSGKSTLITLSYALWAVLGKQRKKNILIVGQTQDQARQHFDNIRKELEENQLLKNDLGPFKEDTTWNAGSLIISRYNTRISAVSMDQKIRGAKYRQWRPDLIILDDVEDSAAVKTKEARDAIYERFTSEIVPLGSENAKIMVIGNLLHSDSLIKRLESDILNGNRTGVYREYPIIDDSDHSLWPDRFPDMASIEKERLKIGNKFTWYREYMLRIIDDREPIIEKEWIQYYQELPQKLRNQSVKFAAGVDLAVSEKSHADYTAIVGCKIVGHGEDMKIYILPNPINEKMRLPHTIDNICKMAKVYGTARHTFYIEEVGTQIGVTQLLNDREVKAVGVAPGSKDKRTRLSIISEWIRTGKIIFPYQGTKELEDQMLNFGTTRYDDLVDALTTLILGIMEKPPTSGSTVLIMDFDRESFYGGGRKKSNSWGPGHGWSIELGSDGQFRQRY